MLLQLGEGDDSLANVEIDTGDNNAEQPLGALNTELTAENVLEQSAAVAGTAEATTPENKETVQVADSGTEEAAAT